MTKTQKWSIRFLKFIFIMICLLIGFNLVQPDIPSKRDIERKVRVTCIIEIKHRLKYPDSMEIVNRVVLPRGENKWDVEIGIKSKNNFGVMAPSNFICSVHLEDGLYQLKNIRNY